MKIKGCHFILTQSGIQETAHENTLSFKEGSAPHILTFCDVLSINEKGNTLPEADSQAIASLIERWITDSLAEKKITEETLTNAIDYANQRILQSDDNGLNQVAVSIVVIAPTQKQNDFTSEHTETGDFLIAGVGDCYVYKVKADKAELIFIDPLNSEIDLNLSPEDRLYSLKNAIGIKENLRVHCRRIQQSSQQRFTCVSYGVYEQSTEEEVREMSLEPNNFQTGIASHLSQKESRGHKLMVHTVSYASSKESKSTETTPKSTSKPPQRKRAAWALAAAALILSAALPAYLVFNHFQTSSSTDEKKILNLSPIKTSIVQSASESKSSVEGALVTKLREKIHNQQQKIDELKKELLSDHQKIDELTRIYDEDSSDELKSQLTSLQKGFAEQAAELKHKKILQQDLEYQLSVTTDKIATLNKTVETLKSIIDAQDNSRDQDVSILQAQFNELQDIAAKDRDELMSTIDRLQEQNYQLKEFIEENIPSGNDTISRADEERSHEKALHEAQLQVEKLGEAFAKEQRRSETLTERLREALQENSEVEDIKASKDERIASLTTSMEKLSSENGTLIQQLAAAKEQASLGQGRIRELENTSRQLEDRLASATGKAEEHDHQMVVIGELQKRLQTEKQARKSRDTIIDQLKNTLQEQKKVLASLEDSRREAQEQLTQTKATLVQQQLTQAATEGAVAAVTAPATRIHLVSSGETLSNIAFRYYGTSKRWQDIYDANRDVIADVDKVKVGTALIIP